MYLPPITHLPPYYLYTSQLSLYPSSKNVETVPENLMRHISIKKIAKSPI